MEKPKSKQFKSIVFYLSLLKPKCCEVNAGPVQRKQNFILNDFYSGFFFCYDSERAASFVLRK